MPSDPPAGGPAQALLERLADWRRRSLGLRGLLLYWLALPLPLAALVALVRGELGLALADAAAFALAIGGARLNRRGLREELIQPGRRFTRPARTPFKLLGAAAVGAATALAAYAGVGQDVAVSLVFGALAVAGCHLAYGLRPPSRAQAPRSVPADGRLAEVLARAEQRILALELAAATVGNPELQQRLQRISGLAWSITDTIVDRPDDLHRARKFLSVYLEGAERVASRYVKSHRLSRSRVLEDKFRRVLVDIERVFEQQHARLLRHETGDLDVQITVLQRQLREEGLA